MGRITQSGTKWQESKLIDWITLYSKKNRRSSILGIGDDASVHQPVAGEVELVTCDALIEETHWSFQWCDPASLGYKAAAVNLSDIAAMGGTPRQAYLVLGLPPQMEMVIIRKVVKSLIDTLHAYGVELAGGDTVASPAGMMISLTLQGSMPKQQILTRGKARPNDLLLVTGHLGDAAAGLDIVTHQPQLTRKFKSLVRKLLRPRPRMQEARSLAQSGQVHAMMDLSDGLAADLRKLLKASQVGARIYAAQIPISRLLPKAAHALQQDPNTYALQGGEDYELLFSTAPHHAYSLIRLLKEKYQTHATIIGEIVPAGMGLSLITRHGQKKMMPKGWEHQG